MPNEQLSGYISRGSKTNPESLDDSDSSAPSSSKPTKEGSTASNPIDVEVEPTKEGSASNPIDVEEGSKFPSETEKEEKPQNSSTNDENGKGGPSSFLLASSPGDEDDDSLGSEDFSDENDSSGSENSSGSKNKDMDTRLGSIQSDRENLNKAISNANPSGKRKAIEELQERYPKKLKNVENVDEFLEKVNEKLTSKTKEVTGSNVSDVDPDEKLNLNEEHVLVDKARNGDKDAVRELQDRFPEFFEGASTSQGLDRVDRLIELEIMDNIRNEKPGLSDSEVEAILASMKENNTKKKDKDKDDDDDDDSKGGGDSASGLGGSTSGPSGGSSSAGPSASGGSSSAGPSGGSSSKVSSPLDYVLEKESIEMPSLFEGDE